ncbi:amino acid adenylation domain-containing protein [Rhodococcus sp. G-MC3]|uniref:amino acid adenylation domain-containing protein n=1 Tax=Rhodococcus sp. G-MC3 TaxID=3046209 RepID=UPI0024BB2945|nr:amino acid adenylation domain-containing protein [Rhodococcus sp. G-MC3]MDJ0396118.1 amino acid adenylation domain-containing protein [Rhodococcus sp. G-MC3]
MHQSLWSWQGSHSPAYTHGLHAEVPTGVGDEDIRSAYHSICSRWWAPEHGEARVWIERVPEPSGGSAAHSRVNSELDRPLRESGPSIRVVVLRYSDGAADLILVSDRRHFDYSSLVVLSEALCGRVDPESIAAQQSEPAGHISSGGQTTVADGVLGWASADTEATPGTGLVVIPLTCVPPTGMLAAAAGLVLARYENLDTATVLAWTQRSDRPANLIGGFERTTVLPVDASPSRLQRDIVDDCTGRLTGDRTGTQAEQATAPNIGILGGGTSPGYSACRSAPFPLTLALHRSDDGVSSLQVFHRLPRVGMDSARQFGRDVAAALQQLCSAEPDTTVGELDLSTGRRLGSSDRVLRRTPQRIEAAFSAIAAQRPGATAVMHGDRRMTYGELDQLSDRFAVGLRNLGVLPGDRVGLCLDRSCELVASMLAVLKAHAVYVPMDVRHPGDRLAYTATDSALSIVVTDLADDPWGGDVSAVRPEDLAQHPPASIAPTPDPDAPTPDHAAYVIYTSGSTGRPKGVVVAHANVDALLAATAELFDLGPEDTWSFFHSSAFDFSVWEIWGALLTGATLLVVPHWVSRSPMEFHRLLVEARVTVLSQTPSAFTQLAVADRDLEPLDAIRLVVFGGEPLDVRTLRDWMDRYPEPRCRLVNMYGITETTVHATAKTVTRSDIIAETRSVGSPLPGWYLDVLDERGRRLPSGVAGEIYIGGAGTALGYLNRPDLTAQRFVVDPATGERIYRTGDLGRLRPDGQVDHLGRVDNQVKIRGFRIELDEIRNVLLDDPAVAASAVVVGGDIADPTGLRIDAYVVAANSDASEIARRGIRRRAAGFLPDYMVPATVTMLAELPLTINGKLDTARLPAPRPGTATATRDRCSADTDGTSNGEQTDLLRGIWESLLGVTVSADDNLFELGGNSLAAIKADAMMRQAGLPVLPMRDLYLHPSIRGICDTLARRYPVPEPPVL